MSPARADGPRWLDDNEMAAWLGLLQLVVELPQALDRQLRAEAGIGHVYYSILAVLSASPGSCQVPAVLARATGTSLSRLSHALDSLEARGLVCRRALPEDPRRQLAELSDAGRALMVRVAPGHVAEVRRLVFDRLEPDEVRQLARIAAKLATGGLLGPGPAC